MQQQQSQPASNGCSEHNGTSSPSGEEVQSRIMDRTNQDIVRLIGQHLKTVGLKYDPFFFKQYLTLLSLKCKFFCLQNCIVGAYLCLSFFV